MASDALDCCHTGSGDMLRSLSSGVFRCSTKVPGAGKVAQQEKTFVSQPGGLRSELVFRSPHVGGENQLKVVF